MRRMFLTRCLFPCLLFVLLLPRIGLAVESLHIAIPTMAADEAGWQLQGGMLELRLHDDKHLSGRIKVTTLRLPTYPEPFRDLLLSCGNLILASNFQCNDGMLEAQLPTGEELRLPLNLEYNSRDAVLRLAFNQAPGRWQHLDLDWASEGPRWQIQVAGQKVDLSLLKLIAELQHGEPPAQASGPADVDIRLAGDSSGPDRIDGVVSLQGAGWSNQATTQAVEDLRGKLKLDLGRRHDNWSGKTELQVTGGYVYLDPVGVDAGEYPLGLVTDVDWQSATERLSLTRFRWQQDNMADLSGDLSVQLGASPSLNQLALEVHALSLDAVYPHYVQPWWFDRDWASLDLAGTARGKLQWMNGQLASLALDLEDGRLADAAGQYQLEGLQAHLGWANDRAPHVSTLGWQQASFYRLPFGPTRFVLTAEGDHLTLSQPAVLPLFDGELQIDSGRLSGVGTEQPSWALDAYLTPVSMRKLTAALGWPEFGGKLSGMIPNLSYQDRRLEVGGTLLVNAFDGDITVRNLNLFEPLGRVPRLQADVEMRNLDLDTLTSTFEFGKIEGRLDGYVRGLDMLAWRAYRFDAFFATPEDDDSRHRISQRAVENLTKIGGGVGGALSRGFLSFLETFPYDRIGLGCTLKNQVCMMRGVDNTQQGYYIVKGRFLPPRIDIVGYSDQVDWPQLLEQIKEATRAGGAQVR